MVRKVEVYEASDGSTHKSEEGALRADLAYLLHQTEALNEGSATQLANYLAHDDAYRKRLVDTLKAFPISAKEV